MLRIALCQLPLDIENPLENISMAEAAIRDSAAQGAQLILLPELNFSRDLSRLPRVFLRFRCATRA